MGAGAAYLMPLSLKTVFCPTASPSTCKLFFRRYPLQPLSSASLPFHGRGTGCTSLASVSQKGRWRSGGVGAADSDGDGWEEGSEAEEEEVEALPFQEMSRWLQNKPTGFGEGKTYDTAVEERLLEEMERSRKAQLTSTNKQRNGRKDTSGPKEQEIEVVRSGIHVRVSNLPRKKNIHRDLQLAFKGFSGIVNISPAVTGNRKTRDPICKGFAFVDLKSEEAADRFVHKYSKQNVLFGKVEKQITCDIINPHRNSDCPGEMIDDTRAFNRPQLTELSVEMPKRSKIKNLSPDSHERTFTGGFTRIAVNGQTDEGSTLTVNGREGFSLKYEVGIEHSDISLSNDAKNGGPVDGDDLGSNDSLSSLVKRRKQEASRKKLIKNKSVKSSKLSVSRSLARLKVKERTVLTGVFSKYGGKVASDLSNQR